MVQRSLERGVSWACWERQPVLGVEGSLGDFVCREDHVSK